MQDLTISWASGTKTFSPADSPVTLGRSLESSVVVSDLTASRRHVIFNWSGDSWVAEDISTHGCFSSLGSALGKNWILSHDQSIRLGDPDGQDIEISVISSSDAVAAVPPVAAPENQMTTVFDESAQAQAGESNPFPAAPVDPNDLGAPPLPPAGPFELNNGAPNFGTPELASDTPANPTFESPGTPESGPVFEAPQPPAEPVFETPDTPAEPIFETPAEPDIPAPAEPVFETPDTPAEPVFETPAEPVFETPDTPAEPVFETPAEPDIPAPAEPVFETPAEPDIPAPAEPVFETPAEPAEPVFETPAEPVFETPDIPAEPVFETPAEPIFETPDSPPLPPNPVESAGEGPDVPPLPPTPDVGTGGLDPAAPFAADMTVRDPNPAAPPTAQAPSPSEPFATPGPPTVPNQPEAPPIGQPVVQQDPVSGPPPANSFDTRPDNFQANTGPTFGQPAAGGGAHWAAEPSTTAIVDNTIRVEVDNKDYTFQPHEEVTIGRDQNCSVVLDKRHALASRQHVRMTYRDNAWWMEDFSSKGTFVDGSPIKNPYRATGGFKALLGNKQAGTEVKIVAPGEHVPNVKSKLPIFLAVGAAVTLLFAAIAGGIILTREDEVAIETTIPSEVREAQFREAAKQSTVLILSNTEDSVGAGSGFFVSDTLIVTNQHVVDGDDLLEIAISTGNDDPVELTYTAEILELHPFLDIAVLQLTGELTEVGEGEGDPQLLGGDFTIGPLGPNKTESVEVGSSDDIVIGSDVFTTGFPASFNSAVIDSDGVQELPPVGADRGGAASFTSWPGCDSPSAEFKIPQGSPSGVKCNSEGDVPRAIATMTFTSGPGASGSAVYQDGKVVAVVFSGPSEAIESNTSRSITSTSFLPWLEPIIAAN